MVKVELLFPCRLGFFPYVFDYLVDKVNFVGVGEVNERGAVAKLHCGGLRFVEGGPIGKSFAVGVAGFGKVDPILLNYLREGCLGGIFFGMCEKFTIDIENVVNVRHSTALRVEGRANGGRPREEPRREWL